ncbi:hypothetical protein CspHIS471_0103080 [Cutaneotrichosporon sp. HIS471]|nr:hypothetical protein CspHIS471_0103080 [Cutaneotrichosporon sp. HIS471]
MGKAQVKKRTAKRHNPIRVPDAHLGGGRADGKANPDKEKQLLPVLEKLKAPEAADRTWACAAVGNLINEDAAMRRLFQSRNVVGALIERLSDDVDDVVVEASGTLRNLAIDGGHEICGEMFNKGIMPHLTALMGKISGTIDNVLAGTAKELPEAEIERRGHLLALTENVIMLVWSLAEASWKTLEAVNAAHGEGLLVKALQCRDQLSPGVALAAAQALFCLTHDNAPFSSALLAQPNALPVLVGIVKADHMPAERDAKGKGRAKKSMDLEDDETADGRALLTRVLIAGTLRNLVDPGSSADSKVGIATLTNEVILPLINGLLDLDLAQAAQRVTQLVTEIPKDGPVLGKDVKVDHKSSAEIKLERVERLLSTVGVGLEILTSICAGLEDAVDEDMEEDGADDEDMDETMGDEDLIARGREPNANGTAAAAPSVNTAATLPHLLSTLSLPTRLLTLAQLNHLSLPPHGPNPSVHPPTTAALSVVHLRALEALNNLLISTSAAVMGGEQLAQLLPPAMWEGVFAIVQGTGEDAAALKAKGQEMRLELMEGALAGAWGLSKTIPAAAPQGATDMITKAIPVLRIEAAARAVDTLASLAARPSVPIEENAAVAQWLVAALTSHPNAEMMVALLNAVIDIYADEGREYDQPVFVANNMVGALTNIVARVRSESRKIDRRKTPLLRARAEEAYENLVAFIKYRRSL